MPKKPTILISKTYGIFRVLKSWSCKKTRRFVWPLSLIAGALLRPPELEFVHRSDTFDRRQRRELSRPEDLLTEQGFDLIDQFVFAHKVHHHGNAPAAPHQPC